MTFAPRLKLTPMVQGEFMQYQIITLYKNSGSTLTGRHGIKGVRLLLVEVFAHFVDERNILRRFCLGNLHDTL